MNKIKELLNKVSKLVFEMNEDEAERHHKFLDSIWGFIDEEEE